MYIYFSNLCTWHYDIIYYCRHCTTTDYNCIGTVKTPITLKALYTWYSSSTILCIVQLFVTFRRGFGMDIP